MNDQKSIFGIAVGLVALFAFWLWASGRYSAFAALASGAPAAVATATTGAASAAANGAGATQTSSAGSLTIPTYVDTSPLIAQLNALQTSTPAGIALGSPQAMAGMTVNGATSGGVSVTPNVFANTSSVAPSLFSASSGNWVSELLGLGSSTTNTPAALGPNPGATTNAPNG
jgi:hypothetical protein